MNGIEMNELGSATLIHLKCIDADELMVFDYENMVYEFLNKQVCRYWCCVDAKV